MPVEDLYVDSEAAGGFFSCNCLLELIVVLIRNQRDYKSHSFHGLTNPDNIPIFLRRHDDRGNARHTKFPFPRNQRYDFVLKRESSRVLNEMLELRRYGNIPAQSDWRG